MKETEIFMKTIGTYATGIFDESAAEIPAYDKTTKRLFVVNANDVEVEVLDLTNPSNPTKITAISASDFGGVANSVTVKNGLVAIAIEDNNKQANGRVVFFNSNDTDFSEPLKVVEVGALPDMLTFTPDGKKVIVANEGEPNDDYTVDPEGSVSIIDIENGVLEATVTTADFTAFNSQKEELIAEGVRIFGINATVAQDLEPEYIGVSSDSQTAYVSLQENNAIGIVDIDDSEVKEIVPLGYKNYNEEPTLTTYFFDEADLPVLGDTETRGEIKLSGFSGLYFDGVNAENGNLQFITIPDRGPDDGSDENGNRIFLLPELQPQLVEFQLNQKTGEIILGDRILLNDSEGNPLTGLPNIPDVDPDTPVDEDGNLLNFDPLGADLEGIVKAEDGTFWMPDEYRPSIYNFDSNGTLIERYVPEGLPAEVGMGVFPEVYNNRRPNRGFEAIAYQEGKIYAFLQTPLNNPVSGDTNITRILEFDPETETTVGEYLYPQEDMGGGSDKIGGASALSKTGEFLVIERDSSLASDSQKNIFTINLANATNLLNLPDDILGEGETFESLTPEELEAKGINPVTKEISLDLTALGYDFTDKPEGLALINDTTIAVINDNDFGDSGIPIGLGIIELNNVLDASDRDDTINIRNYPVFGMYQPDAIATFEIEGETYIITANEGDSRDYDGFSEEERVKDLTLDSTAFPNADLLQQDERLGRLQVTNILGDTNGDSEYEQLYSFGARSFSILNSEGEMIFDSGSQIEEIIAKELPEFFNSTNDDNDSFDSRSDAKGPEPEGVTVGVIKGKTYAFIGLERVGGIMVYNISNPTSPEFVQYLNNRNFVDENGDYIDTEIDGMTNPATGDLGPEGLVFINSEDSPNGKPLLVVANEVSGTTTIYEVEVPQSPLPKVVSGTPEDDFFDTAFPDDKRFEGDEQLLFTGSGNDYVDASVKGENNRIDLGSGDDMAFVGTNNRLIAGDGDDIIFAGYGKGGNRISLGAGYDEAWLITDKDALPETENIISDFNPDEDTLYFANTGLGWEDKGSSWDAINQGNNVLISAFDQNIAELSNVQASALNESNLIILS